MKILKHSIFFLLSFRLIESEIIVNTSGGKLRGTIVQSTLSHSSYIAFKGIPYAEPPIGDFRFKSPIPHRGWSGVRDASEHGNACPTNGAYGITAGGNEDCLFLNVYTTNIHSHRPVMLWIHGGGYLLGSGNSLIYGPSKLVKEHIVVVTINYRLGALGFLSTNDKYSQGNYGLKDSVLALKWVQKNIRNFGGDPNKVTIAGESAGAVSVHLITLSKMARGLFHRAIMMSGSALMPFCFQPNPLHKAQHLAKNLGIDYNSTKEMIDKLRQIHFKDLLRVEHDITHQDKPVGFRSFDHAIVVEPEDAIDERFLTETPENILRKGNFHTVPTMIGTMSMEGILTLALFLKSDSFDNFNNHIEYFVPSYFNISQINSHEIDKIGKKLKNTYFGNEKLSHENQEEFARFMTDGAFKFAIDRSVKFMTNQSKDPIFYYEIDYSGAFNLLKIAVANIKNFTGACHADDLFYLFSPESIGISMGQLLIPRNDHAYVIRNRIVKMWSDFVKHGDPTPYIDDLITLKWPHYTNTNEEYMKIGYNLNIRNHFERLKVWYKIFANYIEYV